MKVKLYKYDPDWIDQMSPKQATLVRGLIKEYHAQIDELVEVLHQLYIVAHTYDQIWIVGKPELSRVEEVLAKAKALGKEG